MNVLVMSVEKFYPNISNDSPLFVKKFKLISPVDLRQLRDAVLVHKVFNSLNSSELVSMFTFNVSSYDTKKKVHFISGEVVPQELPTFWSKTYNLFLNLVNVELFFIFESTFSYILRNFFYRLYSIFVNLIGIYCNIYFFCNFFLL